MTGRRTENFLHGPRPRQSRQASSSQALLQGGLPTTLTARLLDFEEARLPFDEQIQSVRARFSALLGDVLARPDLPRQPGLLVATADVSAIIRGMLDAGGERGEDGQLTLVALVRPAVLASC